MNLREHSRWMKLALNEANKAYGLMKFPLEQL